MIVTDHGQIVAAHLLPTPLGPWARCANSWSAFAANIWSNYMKGQQTTPAPAHLTQPSKATSQQIQHFNGELWWIAAKNLCLTWRERGRIRNISHRWLWPTTVRLWQHICFQPHLGRGQGVQIHGRPLLQISGQTTWEGSKQHQHQHIWHNHPKQNKSTNSTFQWWIMVNCCQESLLDLTGTGSHQKHQP